MRTFRQLYCEKNCCAEQLFHRRLFWECLYPHARPIAALLLLFNRRQYFVADDALLASVADAVTMRRVREEVRDYFWDSNNRGWLRRGAKIRVSGQRLKNIARLYLPESEASFHARAARASGVADVPPSSEQF